MRVRTVVEGVGAPAAIIEPATKRSHTMRMRFPLLFLLIAVGVLSAPRSRAQVITLPPPAGEFMYVSTGTGGQILKVDANSGVVTVLPISPTPSCGTAPACDFEGMVIGPDGKIYVADPRDGDVFRLDQTGQNFETVYSRGSCSQDVCAEHPQNPIFSGSAARDLYFLDPGGNSTNDIFKIAGAGFVGLGGSFAAPSAVIVPDCTNTNSYCELGQGAAFDVSDNLVFDDVPNVLQSVFSSPPPYGTVNEIDSSLSGAAVALNSNTGQVFIADPSTGNIWQVPAGDTPYANITAPDTIAFMAFDATGHLFVVTTAVTEGASNGKVWIIPPGGGTPVELADLPTAYAGGDNGLGLNSDNAVGIALPPTQGETQTAPLSSAAGSFTLSWPVGCPTPSIPCLYTFGITYPAGMFPDGGEAVVTPNDTTEAQWALRTPPGNPFSGTQIAPVAGENGSGVIFSAQCLLSNSPCPVPNPSLSYGISTTWKSSQADYCSLGPGLLKADPIGSDNWVNTLTGCSVVSPDPTYGTKGTSTCSSTTCLSDWANVFGIKYTFVGFASPVDNTATNLAKAGQAIPIKFQVLDSSGNPVSNLTMPPVSIVSASRSCTTGVVSDITTDSTATGNSGFQNLGDGNYQFNWATSKAWSGTCQQLQVNLGDGVIHTANFQFK